MQKIEIYDTTLRDGAQGEGINYSISDKLKIIKQLDALGVTYIEAGWPGANPKDAEVFKQLNTLDLKHAVITAFGCTRRAGVLAADDAVLKVLADCEADIITIFGKTWDFHVIHALNTTLEENLNMISDSIKFLKSKGKRVFFDAEHFFDGFKHNRDYALLVLKTACNVGAERLILCDTNGGCINTEVYKITKTVKKAFPEAKIGIHVHNDGDMAVANSIAAVEAGAVQVQGTINGYGERCGNANLCSIIPNLQIKNSYDCVGEKIKKLTLIAREIAEITNVSLASNAPFVGLSAFAHKGGVHISAVRKNSETYEHIAPELVGNERKILMSDQAGIASVKEKITNLITIDHLSNEEITKVIESVKNLEWRGFAFEGADASFELLVLDCLGKRPKYFDVSGFRVIGDTVSNKDVSLINTEASVKVQVGQQIFHTVAEGDGPVNALDRALRKALVDKYPEIEHFALTDFKVRILDSSDGTAATVRVNIESTDGINKWNTVGVSENIIEASYMAIADSILFGIITKRGL